jgi:hypothetical protein
MKLAERLLDRFDVPESLVGDLVEARHGGRSAVWFWRQAIVAIAQAVIHGVRLRKATTAATALVLSAALFVWFQATLALYRSVQIFEPWIVKSRLLFFAWHIYCVPLNLGWCVGCALAGWLAARLNRRSPAAVVVACALAQFPINIWFGWPYLRTLLQPSIVPTFYVGYVCDTLFAFIALPLCFVAAGTRMRPIVNRGAGA